MNFPPDIESFAAEMAKQEAKIKPTYRWPRKRREAYDAKQLKRRARKAAS